MGRQETQELLDHFKGSFPKLVEDVVPKVVSLALLQRLLQLLLEEGINVKDLRTILEVAGMPKEGSRICKPGMGSTPSGAMANNLSGRH